jgi:sortase A
MPIIGDRAVATATSMHSMPSSPPSPTPVPLPAEIPVRIVIPAIDLDAPITPVVLLFKQGDPAAQWQVPNQRMAGWLNDSAKLGEMGNLVLDGHHNVYGRIFERLKDLQPGAEIIIYGETRAITYSLTARTLLLERGQPEQVRLEHARYIAPTSDQRLTLVTCWPPTDYSHRLILVARPVQENLLSHSTDTNRSGPQ